MDEERREREREQAAVGCTHSGLAAGPHVGDRSFPKTHRQAGAGQGSRQHNEDREREREREGAVGGGRKKMQSVILLHAHLS